MKKWELEKHKSWSTSRRLHGPCYRHGRLFAGKSGLVEIVWLGSGAVALR